MSAEDPAAGSRLPAFVSVKFSPAGRTVSFLLPDLMTGARESVMRMIDLLGAEHGMSAMDAYLLCSVCGDLRISEIVDMPNWVISFYFPRIVFS